MIYFINNGYYTILVISYLYWAKTTFFKDLREYFEVLKLPRKTFDKINKNIKLQNSIQIYQNYCIWKIQ